MIARRFIRRMRARLLPANLARVVRARPPLELGALVRLFRGAGEQCSPFVLSGFLSKSKDVPDLFYSEHVQGSAPEALIISRRHRTCNALLRQSPGWLIRSISRASTYGIVELC